MSRDRDERMAFCRRQTVGQHHAVFHPGQELRCPGTKRLSGGATIVCGASVSGQARVTRPTGVRVVPASPLRCTNCGFALEIFQYLEATG